MRDTSYFMCMKYPMISAALTIDRHIRIGQHALWAPCSDSEVNFDCRQNQKHSHTQKNGVTTVVPLLLRLRVFNSCEKASSITLSFQAPSLAPR